MTGAACLRELGLREEYRSDRDDLLTAFYIPCLEVATSYDRAVGYFTSSGLALAGRGLKFFTERAGKMRLVASPHLTEEDLDAMQRGIAARSDLVARRLLDALAQAVPVPENLVLLAWLLANGRLDIRLAVPERPGIYHEKAGIFEDSDGCRVAFSGSANETVGGLINNFESVDVFFSWDESSGRVTRKAENFSSLWQGRTSRLEVMSLPAAVGENLVTIAREHQDVVRRMPPTSVRERPHVSPPEDFQARDYQKAAVDGWLANGGRGILSMATGSGKTKTALSAVARLLDDQVGARGGVVIVVVPFIHLVDQWADEIMRWGPTPIRCYESSSTWNPVAQEAVDTREIVKRPIVLVTTIRTAVGRRFQDLIDQLDGSSVVLVADEVHHLGADEASTVLRQPFRWRLGLSATPTRWQDEQGSQLLEAYFGGIVFEFDLAAAIAAGCLVPYRYEPILVELDREELTEYRDIVSRIHEEATAGDGHGLLRLLERRTTILNGAAGKPSLVHQDIVGRTLSHALFYCASRLQMGAVSDVLRAAGHIPRPFTAEESRTERAVLLDAFSAGQVPAIVAMRALDEGVDVPGTREAHLLASSGNPREFIQRRGRILRPAPGKEVARLVDYVAVPVGETAYERQLVEREMSRVLDFARTSIDPDRARDAIWPILDAFGLIHLVGR